MRKGYCDTCIYRDYVEKRKGRWVDFAEEAAKLFHAMEEGKYELVVSDHLETQLIQQGFHPQYAELLKRIGDKNVVKVTQTEEDRVKASQAAASSGRNEYEDALHAELAIKGGADVLITRNINDFTAYCNHPLLKIRLPEHIGLF